MSRLKNKQPNIPKANFEDYFYILAGEPKTGKTTLFAKLVEELYGDVTKGILLACEAGYQALKVTAEDVNNWDDFEELVDELVEEKDELPYKIIGIDTGDKLWTYAQNAVIKEWNINNPNKKTKYITGVGAKKKGAEGFGAGYNQAAGKIEEQIDRLFKSGYGVVVVCHSKNQTIEEEDGTKYDQLVVSLPQKAREVFIDRADFITFLKKEKTKTDDGVETKRYMYFRSDGYVDAGCRFDYVPERIEFNDDPKQFIQIFEDAVKAEFGDEKEVVQIKEQQKEQREKEAQEYIKQEKENKSVDDYIKEIDKMVKQIDKAKRNEAANQIENILGTKNYKQIDDVQLLQEALESLEEFVG